MKDAPICKTLESNPPDMQQPQMQLQIRTDQYGPVNVNLSVRSPDCGQFIINFLMLFNDFQ